jgi:hypothetical protein
VADLDSDALRKALSYGAIGFGVLATLTPRVFSGVYGLSGDGNLRTMVRLWGTRTALLGVLGATASDAHEQRRIVTAATVLNAVDSVLTLKAGPEVSLRSRLMGSASSAAFGAVGAYWLSQTK